MERAAITPEVLQHYEGLVRKTAARYVGVVEDHDYDDLMQVFRIKVFRALLSFDPTRSKLPRDRYVFSCLRNQAKDLIRKKRKEELFIEDVAPTINGNGEVRDRFELRYLQVEEEAAYSEVLASPPLIPSTLTQTERHLLFLLYNGFDHTEMSERVKITKREVAAGLKAIREKFADWKPSNVEAQESLDRERAA